MNKWMLSTFVLLGVFLVLSVLFVSQIQSVAADKAPRQPSEDADLNVDCPNAQRGQACNGWSTHCCTMGRAVKEVKCDPNTGTWLPSTTCPFGELCSVNGNGGRCE